MRHVDTIYMIDSIIENSGKQKLDLLVSKTKIIAIILLFKILSGTILFGFQSSESISDVETNADISLYIISNQYEALLEQRINTRLSYYFPSSSFIVTSDINLFENSTPDNSLNTQLVEEPEDQGLWTAVPQFLLSQENGFDEINSELVAQLGIYLNNIIVQINLDQNAGFSNQDQAFIRFAVENIIKYDESRGDQINIQSRSFPASINSINTPPISSNQRMLALMDSLGSNFNNNPFGQDDLVTMAERLENRLNILFLVLLLAFAIGISLVIVRRSKYDQNVSMNTGELFVSNGNQMYTREDLSISNEIVRNLNHTIKNEGLVEYTINKDDKKEDREIESLRFLMKLTSERPTDMARILEYWFESDRDKTVQVIFSVDIKILMMMSPYITKTVYIEMVGSMDELMEEGPKNFKYSLEELAREVKGFEQAQSLIFKYQPVKDFNFVQLLKEKELVSLLSILSLRDIALVFSHLSQNVLLQVSSKMDATVLNGIIKEMYDIQKISLSEYRRRASYIFKEIHLNQQYNHLPDSMITDVVGIIEGLEIDKQREIIKNMKLDDNANTSKIAEQVVTLDFLQTLNKGDLARVIKPIKSDILAYAIKGFEEDLKQNILNIRPERERIYIEKIMSLEDISEDEINSAQRILLTELRKIAKTPIMENVN